MNLNHTWIESSWMKALGWTFVHSIWQIAFIGLLLFIVLKFIPGRSAHARYTISTLALWTTLVTALCTFIIMLPEQKNITEASGSIVLITSAKSISLAAQLSMWLEARMPMMLSIWLGGVALLLLRLLFSLGWVSHLRYDSFPEEQLQSTMNHMIRRLKLNVKASTAESYHVQSPVTIGHLKPMVLFPIGIINQLTPNEVEAILTHELAHIVRRDYLANIIQSFIETLFYYHPVTWWISRMVRTERENRADDLAVSWCGDHLGYAKALFTIQEMQTQSVPNLAVGFASRKGAMLARIQRILNVPYKNDNQMEKTVLLSLCSLCFLAFTLTGRAHDNRIQEKTIFPVAFNTLKENGVTKNVVDSIPSSGTYKIHKKTDSQDISVEVKDGDVKQLKIDGKDIAPSEFNQYDKVIDELFGTIETPPTMEGFGTPALPASPLMPAMPVMPPMPSMDGLTFTMPPMPEMPDMSQLNLELEGLKDLWNEDSSVMTIYNPEIRGSRVRILHDTTIINGKNTIIIKMDGGDSSVICVPGHSLWTNDYPSAIAIDGRMMNEEEMKKWSEEMQRNAAVMDKEWKAQAEQWAAQSKQNNDQWKNEQDKWRSEQARLQAEQERWNSPDQSLNIQWSDDDIAREAERQLADEYSRNQVYLMPSPRLSISDEMVRDGLIQPGQEAQVQLTPDKLKINGHKVSDELHDKYLRMYEHQQGVELAGNSRVEFTTKSKQHM
jgi:beta-lactamase regulating signal transducer with metallopeptidase domain